MGDSKPYETMEDLILRYFSRETSPSEVAELEAWVKADPEHKARFMALHRTWLLSGMARDSDVDIDAAWDRLARATTDAIPVRILRLHQRRRIWRIAATILLIVAAGTVLLMQIFPRDQHYFAQQHALEIALDDGTNVVLNTGAKLTWHRGQAEMRSLSLTGDAYFDVAKDPTRPFRVAAGELTVEVLGTAFYIDVRADQPKAGVTVEHGSVAVRHAASGVVLAAGEQASFDKKTGTLEKGQNTDPNFNSLKTQTLAFENSGLDAVITTLNRHYHTRIVAQPSVLKTCALTATFENKSLDAVLQIIASTTGIEIIHQQQQILMRGSCTLN